jgi:hypothetical protein
MNKVFLGGTCAESTWRNKLINFLDVDYFNPVVDDWTSDCQAREESEKSVDCNIHLYVITAAMTGVFSIAEVIESAHMDGKTTILHVIPEGFSRAQIKSLDAVVNMVIKHGGIAYTDPDLRRSARVINHCFSTKS